MSIPRQTLNIRDPGLGLVEQSETVPLYMGPSSIGTVNTLVSCSDKKAVIAAFGQGPLSEDMCLALDIAGGPVLGMRLTGGVAGAAGSVTKTAVGSSTGTVTVAGAAYDAYEAIITIMLSGTLGAGTFKYSLDDGRTDSEVLTIPSGGTYAIPNTNLTVTFVPGGGPTFFEAGDKHEFDCTAPYMTTTNVGAGFDTLDVTTTHYDFIVLCGRPASASAGATMFASIATRLTSLENTFRYVGLIMDVGIDTTGNVTTSFASVASPRICACYSTADMASSKAFAGWGTPKRPAYSIVAARAARELISTDLMRTASGALEGVVEIGHNEFATEVLDQQKITTLRTWPELDGFYITNARLKSSAGSDFLYWQHRRIMDTACRTTVKAQTPFMGIGVRTNANGTINEKDARRLETIVKDRLREALVDPQNEEGFQGHVSALNYTINRTNNVLTTFNIDSSVAVRPLGYAKTLTTDIGFTTNVGG